MVKFLVRRVFFLILTLFAVSVVIFAVSELAPSNIAVNTLGNTITPEQEASFNAQNGLDQPPVTRYIRWMLGSDWQAAQLIGRPVERVYDAAGDRYTWWIVGADGRLYQTYTNDAETIIKVVRQTSGPPVEEPLGADIWRTDAEGFEVFWGIDPNGRAAMWVRGDSQRSWTLTKATWTSAAGAPRSYIPLQRGLLRGDPGVSFLTQRPVAETLSRRLVNTGYLAGIAFVFIMPLALALGLLAGLNEGKFLDRFLSISSLIATATPEFASGVFLVLIFASWLRWFPGSVALTTDTNIFENPKMLVLPIMTLTLVELGYVLRITRASMVEVMRTNYIRTAVLKGLPATRIVLRHALRNALMAPITVIMLHVNWLVGGLVVVESVFGFPGLGRLALDAALFKDVFVVEAVTMVLIVIAVVSQLLADIVYTFLNPRIRFA
ncbi:MAG: ABC transporter permease subunit [Anaerolineales bacterium]|nr:ABC transporter permease subunit [Anaerolineales bacterium]